MAVEDTIMEELEKLTKTKKKAEEKAEYPILNFFYIDESNNEKKDDEIEIEQKYREIYNFIKEKRNMIIKYDEFKQMIENRKKILKYGGK